MTDLAPFLNPFQGDTGEGGREGLVPGPEAGDAAAMKFLSAAGNWAIPAGPDGGVTTVGSYDSVTPSSDGLVIIGVNIYAQSASNTYPGMVNTASQTLAGTKTFINQVLITSSTNFLVLGSSNATTYTSASTTAPRTFTTPDANSNSIQPLGSGTTSQWVSYIDSNGIQNLTQPAFSDISGTLDLVTQVTGVLLGANGGTGTANTGLTINLASGAVGKVLASDSSGNATWSALTSLGITAVNGTLNRITASTVSGTATIDISASYVGQTSIVTLGTIATGVWNGSIIAGQYGGTGIANTGLTINLGSGTVGKVLVSDSSGNAFWDIAPAAGVTSATGTSGQVLVNATFGIAQTGAIILTLPQSIATTSSVTFANLTATTKVTTATFQMTTSPTNGYVMTSDVSGNGSWTALSTLGIVTVSGTTNRITANTVSGAVTIDIAATYVGQSSITTLGTIATGVWQGTLLAGQYGGTGVANTGLTINLSSGAVGKVLSSDSSGNATWTALSSFGVTTITGNTTQIIVNGGTGPASGAITLSLPQSIATTSNVTFNSLTTTVKVACATFQMTTSPTNGYVLTSDASGNGAWTPLSGIGVSSATGTANQVLVNGTTGSSQTGAITLTLPQSIATSNIVEFAGLKMAGASFITSISAPASTIFNTGGYTCSLDRSIYLNAFYDSFERYYGTGVAGGITISSTLGVLIQSAASGSGGNAITWSGLLTLTPTGGFGVGTSTVAANRYMIIQPTVTASSGLGIGLFLSSSGIYNYGANSQEIDLVRISGGTLDTSSATGLIYKSLYIPNTSTVTGTGTIATAYGLHIDASNVVATTNYSLYVSKPSAGTNKYTAYFDGIIGIGSMPNIAYQLYVAGSLLATSGNIYATRIETALGASSGTITSSTCCYIVPTFTGNAGTITTAYGLIVGAGSTAGTITTGYGLYVSKPAYGTNNYTAYFDNVIGIGITPVANIQLRLGSSITGTGLSSLYGLNIATDLGSTSGTISFSRHLYISPTFTSNVGTITEARGMQIDAGSGGGTISHATSAFISMPGYGNDKYGLQVNGAGTVAAGQTLVGAAIWPQIGCSSGTLANAWCTYVKGDFSANAATISTAYGLFVETGIGGGTITTGYGLYVQRPTYGTNKYTAYLDPIVAIGGTPLINCGLRVSGAIAYTSDLYGMIIDTDLGISSGTASFQPHLYINPIHTSNVATISAAYGCYIATGTTAGTVTSGCSLYVASPSYGTNKYTAYFDGGVGIGTFTANGTGQVFAISANTTSQYWCDWRGSCTGSNATTQGFNVGITAAPGANITEFNQVALFPQVNCSGKTITTLRNLHVQVGSLSAGTVTTAIGLTVDYPGFGTTRWCSDLRGNVRIGQDRSGQPNLDLTIIASTASSGAVTGGSAQGLPANPVGYIGVVINGNSRAIPYYAASFF